MNKDNNFNWAVCVRCYTYNQAPYIVDTMNGFTIQQTNFPFVCVIVDDASTDGETGVIRDYVATNFIIDDERYSDSNTDDYELIFAQHKTNVNCYFAVLFLKFNHYQIKKPKLSYVSRWNDESKYLALCEGDDYWIDPLKLQEQVDFLDNNCDYSMVHSRVNILEDETMRSSKYYGTSSFETLLKGNKVQTLTACYRKTIFNEYLNIVRPSEKNWGMTDYPLWLFASLKSKVYCFNKITGVYRKLSDSASHFRKPDYDKEYRYRTSIFDIQLFFAELAGRNELKDEILLNRAYTSLMLKCRYDRQDVEQDRQVILHTNVKTIRSVLMILIMYLYPRVISYNLLKKILLKKHSMSEHKEKN